jgi:enamine deaminase RidA (YjgF/YER057c/UK114 family)
MELEAVLPAGWSRPPGWSNAMVAPSASETINVAGQFGWDPQTQKCVSGDFGEQWEQALRNVRTVVESAGGTVPTISVLRIYVTDLEQYHAAGKAVGAAWMAVIGKHFPAMTLLHVVGLTDPDALVEIEAVAHRPTS